MAKKASGFTLVELLVVISIITILSVIGVTVFSGIQKNARDAKRKADVEAIAKAMESRFDSANSSGSYGVPQDSWFASGSIPKDPIYKNCDDNINNRCMQAVAGLNWGYNIYSNEGNSLLPKNSFFVCARLERGSGGNFDDMWLTTPTPNGETFCLKNQQ